MISFPNAKINIGLFITEKRIDGFHNLESCFFPIPWTDILEIIPSDCFSFSSSGIEIPNNTMETNLCVKAYNLLANDFDISPVKIHLHKNIPIGAGLGGGSADASFTLKMLNDLFDLKISDEKLENYARQLGSDCAFFIQNKPVFAFEKGDIFKELSLSLKDKFIVLINPTIHISTKEAYSGVKPKQATIDLHTFLAENSIENWKEKVHNDFEDSIFPNHSTIAQLKNDLYNKNALYASMTGSGSTVFGIFENEIDTSDFKKSMIFSSRINS